MRVVLAADISGTRDGKAWPPRGTEVDLPDYEADALLVSGAALKPDDERVKHIRGYVATDVELAGAPTGRDITEGQPDTNLARARYLAEQHQGDVAAVRAETRAAAEAADYTDEKTVPLLGAAANGDPVVGDDNPAPAQLPGAAEPNPTVATRDGDDGVGTVESADASAAGEERAVTRTAPKRR